MKTTKIITLIAMVVLAVSCKKEKETDNPNINHRTIDIELKSNSYILSSLNQNIDINDDGVQDFRIDLYLNRISNDEFNYSAAINSVQTGNELLSQVVNTYHYLKALTVNQSIDSGSGIWYNFTNAFVFLKSPIYPNTDIEFGFAGKGDVLIGFRFMIGTELHYGWMKINVTADYKSIVVKEVAYEIRPNVEVKAGEK